VRHSRAALGGCEVGRRDSLAGRGRDHATTLLLSLEGEGLLLSLDGSALRRDRLPLGEGRALLRRLALRLRHQPPLLILMHLRLGRHGRRLRRLERRRHVLVLLLPDLPRASRRAELAREPRRLRLSLVQARLSLEQLLLELAERRLLLRDALLGAPRRTDKREIPSVAFLGSRGVPARYSGFEVVVEELGKRLAARGHQVTVYNRLPHFGPPEPVWEGMKIIGLPTIPTKSLDTIVHTTLSMLDAMRHKYDIIYLCGVGNAILGRLARLRGMKVVINVDGADFRRKKWRGFARSWLQRSERWAVNSADCVIADSATIADRYEKNYGTRPEHLSYGLTVRDEPVRGGELEKWHLRPDGYFIYVSRLTPENEAELLLEAYRLLADPLPLVIVGDDPYEHAYKRRLRALSTPNVIFAGQRFADAYIELSQNARAFVMPATIEATRLVLLDQIGMGKAIIYQDCAATREVLGGAGIPFGPADPVRALAAKLEWAQRNSAACAAAGKKSRARAELFRWETVLARYEKIFQRVLGSKIKTD